MHAISSYRGNRPTHTQTHIQTHQTEPITIHCAAASAARSVIN